MASASIKLAKKKAITFDCYSIIVLRYKMTSFIQEFNDGSGLVGSNKLYTDSCYCVFCGGKNEALLDRYVYKYGNSHGNNLKGLDWNNFNKMSGSGLTTKCSCCSDVIYRIKIIEENSPTIRTAKLKKEQIMDIGYYARMRDTQEIVLFGADNKVKVGSGPKPVLKSDVPVTNNYYTGSLRSITYKPPTQPTVKVFCPVCSATARLQPSLRPSEANLFCRHCQLQFRAESVNGQPFANVLIH